MMGSWRYRRLVAVAISPITIAVPIFICAIRTPIAIPVVHVNRDRCGLSRSSVGIENAQAMRMPGAIPVRKGKDQQTVLESAGHIGKLAIDQQLRAWLEVAAGESDCGMSVRVRWEGHCATQHPGNCISQARQLSGGRQAFGKSQTGQKAAQNVDRIELEIFQLPCQLRALRSSRKRID